MTCIVGLKSEKGIYMAADSAGVDGHRMYVREDKKIFFVRDMLIGGAGSFRVNQILQYHLNPPPIDIPDTYQWMVTQFIPHVIDLFRTHGVIQDDRGNSNIKNGYFLVAFKGQLYTIFTDFQVAIDQDSFSCIGSGHEVASGAMYATDSLDLDPSTRVKLAIEAAARYITSVRLPVNVEFLKHEN